MNFKKYIFVPVLFTAFVLPLTSSAAEKFDKDRFNRVYDEKTLYFQYGTIFTPDRVVQGDKSYLADSEDVFKILSAYPASASEIENFRTTSVLGGVLLGSGAIFIVGGLFVPKLFPSWDAGTVNAVTLTAVIAGAVMGIGGFWLMNSDLKQNFLLRSIWYYNESVLFEDKSQFQGAGRTDVKFGIFSYMREF